MTLLIYIIIAGSFFSAGWSARGLWDCIDESRSINKNDEFERLSKNIEKLNAWERGLTQNSD